MKSTKVLLSRRAPHNEDIITPAWISSNYYSTLFSSLLFSPLSESTVRRVVLLSVTTVFQGFHYIPKEIMRWGKKYSYRKSRDNDNSHWTWNNFSIHRHIQVSFAPAIKLSHWSHRACVGISLGSMKLLICNESTLNSLEPKLAKTTMTIKKLQLVCKQKLPFKREICFHYHVIQLCPAPIEQLCVRTSTTKSNQFLLSYTYDSKNCRVSRGL